MHYFAGRTPGWSYDADGRLLSRNEESPNGLAYQPARFQYDAAGRRVGTTQTTSRQLSTPAHPIWTTAVETADTYDGDGLGVRRTKTTQLNSNSPSTSTIYYLRSSVLGGRLVAEYSSAGVRQTAYAYAGGEPLAVVQGADTPTPSLRWQHTNPVTGDARETDATGRVKAETHLDPGGADVGTASPFGSGETGDIGGSGEGMSQASVDARVASLIPGWGGPQCVYEGLLVGCAVAESVSRSGGVVDAVSGVDPSDTMTVGGSRWVDKWEDCTQETPGADICQRNVGYFEDAPDEALSLTTYIAPQNTPTPCDLKVGALFGSGGAVARTAYDYNGRYRGYDPAAEARLKDSKRIEMGNPLYDAEHLYWFPHLSGNQAGTQNTEIYVPGDYQGRPTRPTPTDHVVTFYYPNFLGMKNVTLAVFHVGDFGLERVNDRVRVGRTGGPGGDSGGPSPNRHAHFELWKGKTGFLPPGAKRDAARIPLTPVICPPGK